MAESKIAVETCEARDRAKWNGFVADSPTGSFYHRFEWGEINRDELGVEPHYLSAVEDGKLVGVLPLNLVSSRWFGRILCSMPYVNYGGPCAASDIARDALVDAAIGLADRLDVGYLELRCREPLTQPLHASLHKVSMTIALDEDPDRIWTGFSSKHRTAIRRANKNGLVVESGGVDLLVDFYSVMELSWRALGTPLYNRSYFRRIVDTFGDETRIFVVRSGRQAVAAAFNGYFNGTVEGMWAGGGPLARKLQANYALYWEMIRDACSRGYSSFHLGRSTVASGGEDFKSKWNAYRQQLYWYSHRPDAGDAPELNVDNPRYRAAIEVWKRLPLWTTRILGPSLARGIP